MRGFVLGAVTRIHIAKEGDRRRWELFDATYGAGVTAAIYDAGRSTAPAIINNARAGERTVPGYLRELGRGVSVNSHDTVQPNRRVSANVATTARRVGLSV
jgi:hypothetical protein